MTTMDTLEIAVPIPEAAKILGDVLSAQVVSGYPQPRPGVLRFNPSGWGGRGLSVLVHLPDLHEDAVRWLILPLLDPATGREPRPDPMTGGEMSERDRALASETNRGAVKAGPDGFLGVYLGEGSKTRPDFLIGPPTAENLAPLVAAYAAWAGKRAAVPAWVKRAGHLAERVYEGTYDYEKKKAKGWR